MSTYFEAQVSYLRQNENGLIKAVKEIYLVNALSFTEVEARLITELSASNREIAIKAIKRSNIHEFVAYGDTPELFKVKVTYTVTDDESEKGKNVTIYILMNAKDAEEAYLRTKERLDDPITGMLVAYELPVIAHTKIVEVFEYVGKRPLIPVGSDTEEE